MQEFGLGYYESKAIEVLLKEQTTAKQLSKKAGIPSGKVYSILQDLVKKGLILQTNERPKQFFVPDADIVLDKLIQQKQAAHEHAVNNMRSTASEIARSRSQYSKFFEIGTSLEDNREIQLRTFNEAKQEVCQILNIHHKPKSNRSSKTIWEKEIIKAIKRGVVFRSIYPTRMKLPVFLNNIPQAKFQVKRINTDFVRCDIIDKKKVMIKLINQDATAYGGILFIEDEKFAKNLQHFFEQLWLR